MVKPMDSLNGQAQSVAIDAGIAAVITADIAAVIASIRNGGNGSNDGIGTKTWFHVPNSLG